jgi:DNA-binding NarL/FixJ family response regulator
MSSSIFSKPIIRLIIADDHQLFREGIRQALFQEENIKIMAEASDGRALLEKSLSIKPDVILTDIKMPVMDGIEASKAILEKLPNVKIIGLSMFDDEANIVDMLEAGAKGYLIKNADKNEIIEAINTVYEDDPYYCKHTSFTLAKMISGSSRFNPNKRKEKPEFTEREIEIIELICQQLTNKEIGDKLYISTRTVEGHRMKIQEKMQVKNSIGIVIYAIKNGLYKPD